MDQQYLLGLGCFTGKVPSCFFFRYEISDLLQKSFLLDTNKLSSGYLLTEGAGNTGRLQIECFVAPSSTLPQIMLFHRASGITEQTVNQS